MQKAIMFLICASLNYGIIYILFYLFSLILPFIPKAILPDSISSQYEWCLFLWSSFLFFVIIHNFHAEVSECLFGVEDIEE